jgi:hypothetical protein
VFKKPHGACRLLETQSARVYEALWHRSVLEGSLLPHSTLLPH